MTGRDDPPKTFLSPIRVVHARNNRASKWTIRMISVGEHAAITLSYASKPDASNARQALLQAKNAHGVPSETLWCAIVDVLLSLSQQVVQASL